MSQFILFWLKNSDKNICYWYPIFFYVDSIINVINIREKSWMMTLFHLSYSIFYIFIIFPAIILTNYISHLINKQNEFFWNSLSCDSCHSFLIKRSIENISEDRSPCLILFFRRKTSFTVRKLGSMMELFSNVNVFWIDENSRYISLFESCQTHNTQMSIMSNMLNNRTMINTKRNMMASDL